jgi:hypothetical protein
LSQLVYVDTVVMHDPLARYFDPEAGAVPYPPDVSGRGRSLSPPPARLYQGEFGHYGSGHEAWLSKMFLAEAMPRYAELAPLIDDGAILMVPHLHLLRARSDEMLAAVHDDLSDPQFADLLVKNGTGWPPLIAENVRGGTVPAHAFGRRMTPRLRQIVSQDPSYMQNRNLIVAAATEARYAPTAPIDWKLFERSIERAGDSQCDPEAIHVKMIPAISGGVLPLLGELDVPTIVSIRRNDANFDDWRAELREVIRSVESSPADGANFRREVQSAVADRLEPKIRAIRSATTASATLRKVAGSSGEVLLSGAITAGIAVGLGLNPAVGAIGGGVSASVKLVREVLFKPTEHGSKAVLARLVEGK